MELKRINHATTTFYKPFDKTQLLVFFISQISFLILPIILLLFQFQWIAVISLIGFRYLFAWIVLGFSAGKLKEKDVMYWFPIVEIILIFTQLNLFTSNIYSKPVYWK
jgi:hypothetical protein